MKNFAPTLIALLAGSTLVIHSLFLNDHTAITKAKKLNNQTNVHQLATVLELYYLDHNSYPKVTGGEALIETLYKEGYIETKPLNPSLFDYEMKNQDDYLLSIK